MKRKLVAYFSASGNTAKLAENLADAIGADVFAIEPMVPYTNEDLDSCAEPGKRMEWSVHCRWSRSEAAVRLTSGNLVSAVGVLA